MKKEVSVAKAPTELIDIAEYINGCTNAQTLLKIELMAKGQSYVVKIREDVAW